MNDDDDMAALNFAANLTIVLVLCVIVTVGMWEIFG